MDLKFHCHCLCLFVFVFVFVFVFTRNTPCPHCRALSQCLPLPFPPKLLLGHIFNGCWKTPLLPLKSKPKFLIWETWERFPIGLQAPWVALWSFSSLRLRWNLSESKPSTSSISWNPLGSESRFSRKIRWNRTSSSPFDLAPRTTLKNWSFGLILQESRVGR